MKNQFITYLRNFHSVNEAEAGLISTYFEERFYKEGDDLFTAGKVCREMFFVAGGVLRIYSISDKAIDLTHYFFHENQLCTVLQSFNEETPAFAGIQAATDAIIFAITKNKLQALYQKLPFIKDIIDERTQLQLLEKVNIHNAFAGADAETRYKLFVSQNPDIARKVALKDIASFLGITPQSLSRIRKHIV
jgi:CRP-like cAMP-binding protein